ncbi:hypothetical protein GGS21DRAFT_485934 [Xylaria nigripes]|nr:hypothetical protein GGS21DRAFT_485934 [Xylaria nigripes]
MNSSKVLSEKDANSSLANKVGAGTATKPEIKSLEYHRQVLKSKMEQERYNESTTNNTAVARTGTIPSPGTTTAKVADVRAPFSQKSTFRTRAAGLAADPNASGNYSGSPKYVSPSDTIMSPCTAKLTALKGRQAGKAKPRSLFAQASAKKFAGENVFGARNTGSTTNDAAQEQQDE